MAFSKNNSDNQVNKLMYIMSRSVSSTNILGLIIFMSFNRYSINASEKKPTLTYHTFFIAELSSIWDFVFETKTNSMISISIRTILMEDLPLLNELSLNLEYSINFVKNKNKVDMLLIYKRIKWKMHIDGRFIEGNSTRIEFYFVLPSSMCQY